MCELIIMATEEQTWKSLVYNTNITPDQVPMLSWPIMIEFYFCLIQVHTFYKTWAETYEDDMNKLNFTGEV